MKMVRFCGLICILLALTACSPVKVSDHNQYRISAFSTKVRSHGGRALTLQVTPPEAVAGLQSAQMLYMKKPFLIEAFAKNAWTNPPAEMLYPLMVESLQRSHYFYAVKSSNYAGDANYRLDTLLLNLQQNFLKKPSVIEFTAKVTLTSISTNTPVASRIISIQIPCPSDTPYGGVVAANRASYQFTAQVTDFVLSVLGAH